MQAILLNIRHGGGSRAQSLLEWLTARSPDVVVMPEWRDNSSGDVLRRGLEARGLQVATATPSKRANGILLAAKRPFQLRQSHAISPIKKSKSNTTARED